MAQGRDDFFDILDDFDRRLKRVESMLAEFQKVITVGDSAATPDPPSVGGLFYVEGGVPKFLPAGGSPQTITTT